MFSDFETWELLIICLALQPFLSLDSDFHSAIWNWIPSRYSVKVSPVQMYQGRRFLSCNDWYMYTVPDAAHIFRVRVSIDIWNRKQTFETYCYFLK